MSDGRMLVERMMPRAVPKGMTQWSDVGDLEDCCVEAMSFENPSSPYHGNPDTVMTWTRSTCELGHVYVLNNDATWVRA